jgi:hypothetical protein
MSGITPEGLAKLVELVRQVRAIPQLREKQKGSFDLLGQRFVDLREDGDQLYADLRKAAGMGTERFPLDDSSQRRKFVDEAKRRATRLVDDAS